MISTHKIAVSIVFVFFAAIVFAQQTDKNAAGRKELKSIAKEQIHMLHNQGALLVRLTTRKKAIEALRSQGKQEQADKLQKEQDERNKAIVKAFKQEYKFSPAYFFFSDYSQNILENKINTVPFLGEDLIPDKNIVMDKEKFLTAEFSSLNAESLDGTALVVMDDKFNKLKRPFPFYVRIYQGLPFERSPAAVVRKLDKKLDKFYAK